MLRSVVTAAAAAMLVSGCMAVSSGAPSGSSRGCLVDNAQFADAWTCVRTKLVAKQTVDGHPDGLIDEGDLLAAQVKAGKVSEAEGRKRLTAGLAHDAS